MTCWRLNYDVGNAQLYLDPGGGHGIQHIIEGFITWSVDHR